MKRRILSPNFLTFKRPRNLFQGIDTASLCSLAGRYDNAGPTRFPATIDCFKIPALFPKSLQLEDQDPSVIALIYTKKLLTVRLEVDEDFKNFTAHLKCLEFDDPVI